MSTAPERCDTDAKVAKLRATTVVGLPSTGFHWADWAISRNLKLPQKTSCIGRSSSYSPGPHDLRV